MFAFIKKLIYIYNIYTHIYILKKLLQNVKTCRTQVSCLRTPQLQTVYINYAVEELVGTKLEFCKFLHLVKFIFLYFYLLHMKHMF